MESLALVSEKGEQEPWVGRGGEREAIVAERRDLTGQR